jgi:hypothetical protein
MSIPTIRNPLQVAHSFELQKSDVELDFLLQLNEWSHYVTLTYKKSKSGHTPCEAEVLRRSRLFLSRLNRCIFGRQAQRRYQHRIGSCAFIGWGAYGDHPHTHWLLAKAPHQSNQFFAEVINRIASTTSGIGQVRDVQIYYDQRALEYALGHGFENLIHEVTFAAKCSAR